MINPTKKILMHTLELAVCITLAFVVAFVSREVFGIDLNDTLKVGLILALGAIFKTARVSKNIPVKDYVNE